MTYTNMESSPHDRTYKLKATANKEEKSSAHLRRVSELFFGVWAALE